MDNCGWEVNREIVPGEAIGQVCIAVAHGLACSARDREDETSWDRIPAAAFCSSRNILEQDIRTKWLRSTQPFIPPGSIKRVPASAGVMAGTSSLSGGR